MEKPTIVTGGLIPDLKLQQYERYLPTAFDNSLTILEKINKIIKQLNLIGESNNNVITQWNKLIEWILNSGLEEMVSEVITNKINDGTFDQLFDSIIGALADLDTSDKTNIVNAINELVSELDSLRDAYETTRDEMGDITTLQTSDKTTIVNAINEVKNDAIINRQAPTTIGEATGYGTISGFLVRQQAVPSMAVEVGNTTTPNIVHMPSGIRYVIPSATLAIEPSDTTLNRIDLVYVNQNGLISVRKGVPSANPVAPTYQGEEVPLAHVAVVANDTSVNNSDITDKRPLKNMGSLTTDRKENLVLAINELVQALSELQLYVNQTVDTAITNIEASIGDKATLQTDDKTTIVASINEVLEKHNELNDDIRAETSFLENVINETIQELGDIQQLPTNDKSSVVNSIIETVNSLRDVEQLIEDTQNDVNENKKLLTDIWYNVEDYGAIAGTSDSTQAINAAISACVANGGGTVFFPRLYTITQTIVKPEKVSFTGINFMVSGLLWRGGNVTSMIDTTNQALHGTSIENMRISNQSGNANVTGILGGSTLAKYNSAIGVFRNLFIDRCAYGIRGDAEPDGVGIFDCLFDNVWLAECQTGLSPFGSGNVVIHPRVVLCDTGVAYNYLNPESYTAIHMIGGIFVQNNYDLSVPKADGCRPSSFIGTWFEQAEYGIINIPNLDTRIMSMTFQNCMLNTNSTTDLISFYGAWGAITIDTCTVAQSVNGAKNIVRPLSQRSRLSLRNSFLINLNGSTELLDDTPGVTTTSFVKVTITSNQVVAKDTNTLVTFNSLIFDDLAEYNTGSNWFTPREPGKYALNASLQLSPTVPTSMANYEMLVYQNGTLMDKIAGVHKPSGDGIVVSLNGSGYYKMALGDTLQIYVRASEEMTILATDASTFMKVVRTL